MVCLACEVVARGGTTTLAHTCPESGTWLASEAHDAGEDQAPSLGCYTVSMSFRIRAASEIGAREKLTPLVHALLDDDLVESSEFFVSEEAVTA